MLVLALELLVFAVDTRVIRKVDRVGGCSVADVRGYCVLDGGRCGCGVGNGGVDADIQATKVKCRGRCCSSHTDSATCHMVVGPW